MSANRDISNYFQPSSSNETSAQRPTTPPPEAEEPARRSPSTSPLSSCPASFASQQFISPIPLRTAQPYAGHFGGDGANDLRPSSQPRQTQSFGGSFSSSQRVMRNGKPVVISSDGEDTESVSSDESVEDLLRKFSGRSSTTPKSPEKSPGPASRATDADRTVTKSRPRRSNVSIPKEPPRYKFSLAMLVNDAVSDKETEANVAKIRASMQKKSEKETTSTESPSKRRRNRLLESLVDDDADSAARQRLQDAIERTEAFDQGKSWKFFEEVARPSSPSKFPQKSLSPATWEFVLKDPSPRDRAFFSGIVAESFSATALPDELLLWTFNSIATEHTESLRYAYCSTLKRASSERISSLIDASHIDRLFRSLGAKHVALSTCDIVQPEYDLPREYKLRDHRHLLSVVELLGGLSPKFNDNTREHALKLMLRLALDEATMSDPLVCLEAEKTITALLEQTADFSLYGISLDIFKTVQDVALQSQLLKHIPPSTSRIALFRCRLALAFLYRDKSPLDKPTEHLFDIKQIGSQLQDDRFAVNKHKSARSHSFDFWDLASLTTVLDIAIDSGRASASFPDKRAEEAFNRDVDALADRVKVVFTSIQDTGASHLKRTETKEGLQALYYRLIYAVRTRPRPRPKKAWFVSERLGGGWAGMEESGNMMDRFLSNGAKGEG